MNLDRRLAGILMHPTSLPGRFGIGDLGPECYRFLDWVRDAGLAYWQVLPLGPTSYGDSPYQCFSAFAGNPLLISPEALQNEGLVAFTDLEIAPHRPDEVDYGTIIEWKNELLRKAFDNFTAKKPKAIAADLTKFLKRKDVAVWIEDYAIFRVCKDIHGGRAWCDWDVKLRKRDAKALSKIAKDYATDIEFHKFAQFLFFRQWDRIRDAAKTHGISIVGDAPIYVAYDSADTWANQDLFQLDKDGTPEAVAGVPPDYFSVTGQLWGNPLYRWDALKARKYDWWIDRFASIFSLVDYVRLDHFRGFMGYWAVPFGEPTAENGKWIKGPGADFFAAVKKKFKDLPIIAEDLGEITPDVIEVRDEFGLPGMKIMQFAWSCPSVEPLISDPDNFFQLHNHVQNCVVYTGTHDNDTTVGWWNHSSSEAEHHHLRTYFATDGSQPHWTLIRACFMSVAKVAIVPMQDFLGLDTDARMNFPGKASGNWGWRLLPEQLNWELASFIRGLTLVYQRCATPPDIAIAKDNPEKRDYLKGQ